MLFSVDQCIQHTTLKCVVCFVLWPSPCTACVTYQAVLQHVLHVFVPAYYMGQRENQLSKQLRQVPKCRSMVSQRIPNSMAGLVISLETPPPTAALEVIASREYLQMQAVAAAQSCCCCSQSLQEVSQSVTRGINKCKLLLLLRAVAAAQSCCCCSKLL